MKIASRQPVHNSGHTSEWTYDDIVTARSDLETAGFTCMDSVLGSKLLSDLRSEAIHKKKVAVQVCGTSQCQYQAHLAGLGKAGIALLTGGRISTLLDNLFDTPLKLEEAASCYTYYQPGDFLGPHLDIAELCLVTVIFYLEVSCPEKRTDKTGLELHILGKSPTDENNPHVVLPTKAGFLIIGAGSVNWHKRPTLQNGEFITALTACYSNPNAT